MLIEDAVALGIALRGQLAIYLRAQDGEVASRVGTLVGQRRQSLAALGLERVSKELDLTEYLESKATDNGAGGAIITDPDTLPAEETSCTPSGNGGERS